MVTGSRALLILWFAVLAIFFSAIPTHVASAAPNCNVVNLTGKYAKYKGVSMPSINLCSGTSDSRGPSVPAPQSIPLPVATCQAASTATGTLGQAGDKIAITQGEGAIDVPASRQIAPNRWEYDLVVTAIGSITIQRPTWTPMSSRNSAELSSWWSAIVNHESNHFRLHYHAYRAAVETLVGGSSVIVQAPTEDRANQKLSRLLVEIDLFADEFARQVNDQYDVQSANGINEPNTTGGPTTRIADYLKCGELVVSLQSPGSLQFTVGQPVTMVFEVTRDDGGPVALPINWSVSGAPSGMQLVSPSGTSLSISGTPTVVGPFTITSTATDQDGRSDTLSVSGSVVAAPRDIVLVRQWHLFTAAIGLDVLTDTGMTYYCAVESHNIRSYEDGSFPSTRTDASRSGSTPEACIGGGASISPLGTPYQFGSHSATLSHTIRGADGQDYSASANASVTQSVEFTPAGTLVVRGTTSAQASTTFPATAPTSQRPSATANTGILLRFETNRVTGYFLKLDNCTALPGKVAQHAHLYKVDPSTGGIEAIIEAPLTDDCGEFQGFLSPGLYQFGAGSSNVGEVTLSTDFELQVG
jgi:hypothetical protein